MSGGLEPEAPGLAAGRGWLPVKKNAAFSTAFLMRIPKTDLHVHLDGSMRLATLIDLAREQGVELPAYTVEDLRKDVFLDTYPSLEAYLRPFQYLVAVMRSPEALRRVAYEFAVDNFEENVHYFECRFAPQLHASESLEIVDVLRAVNDGLARARDEYNSRPEVVSGDVPEYQYSIIACAMRFFHERFSPYYKSFCEVHKHEPRANLYGMASVALVYSVIEAVKEGISVTGLDLAGAESGFPAQTHSKAFQLAKTNFLHLTVHAGEGYGPESIHQAIKDLHAQRIGHGFHLFSADRVRDPDIADKVAYVHSLAEAVADSRILCEVCLTSNMQTMPELSNLREHAFGKMLEHRVSASLCTDNRTVSGTTVTREIRRAVDAFDMTPTQLKSVIMNGFKRCFFAGTYAAKRHFIRSIALYWEKLAAEEGLIAESDD